MEGAVETVLVDERGDVVEVLIRRVVSVRKRGVNAAWVARHVAAQRFAEKAERGRGGVWGEAGHGGRPLVVLEMRGEEGGGHQGGAVGAQEGASSGFGVGRGGGCQVLLQLVDRPGGAGQVERQDANVTGTVVD